ncbi:MAG: alkyl sulfatase dimerization domain-containing protein, partial [Gammaproteobacteria bacterium]
PRYAEAGYTVPNPQDRPTPDIRFEDRYAFELGGLEVELMAVPGAETNDSLVLWLPQHRIVLTGNLFGCPFGHFPNLVTIRGDRYRDALTCAAAAQTVLDLGAELLLYGHHEPVVGAALIREELTAWRDAVLHVHDAVVAGMNAGKSLQELQSTIRLPATCEVGQGYGKVDWSIRAIWENYAGWFKHESTTELYTVPQSAIHADLVALAGADALLQAARAKLDAGRREEALHFLDILLNAEPEHAGARSLAIEVHQSLLADARIFCTTGNFWLEGWLEESIRRLGGEPGAPLVIR